MSLKQIPRTHTEQRTGKAFETKPVALVDELPTYAAIAFGSPVHFGNMSADMRYFLDQTLPLWADRKLEGIPATVFMAAGSGAGREVAILSFWSTLAVYGMTLVPAGLRGTEQYAYPTGKHRFWCFLTNLSLWWSPHQLRILGCSGTGVRPRPASHGPTRSQVYSGKTTMTTIDQVLKKAGIQLPPPPKPVGNYCPYVISGKNVYINQIGIENDRLVYQGIIGKDIHLDEAKKAVYQTMLNIISQLREACEGNLDRVNQCVQLTGFFYTEAGYKGHALLMDVALDLLVTIFGAKGKHARATVGASSLPENAPVEIQAIFELE